MMRPIFFAALTLALLVPTMKADAQQKVKKATYGSYCLQSSEGYGGGMSLYCYYATLAQCMASKVNHGDWCMQNPAIGFSKRGS
jgi:hypothetical protein